MQASYKGIALAGAVPQGFLLDALAALLESIDSERHELGDPGGQFRLANRGRAGALVGAVVARPLPALIDGRASCRERV